MASLAFVSCGPSRRACGYFWISQKVIYFLGGQESNKEGHKRMIEQHIRLIRPDVTKVLLLM